MLINGAGATFPYPIYSKWFDVYAKENPGIKFNYQSIGSGGGIRMLSNRTVDLGASDAPMTDQQLSEAPGKILHFPKRDGGGGDRVQPARLHRHAALDGSVGRGHLRGQSNQVG